MIRAFQPQDLPQVMELWLAGNLQAHHFIPASYWQDNHNMVREQLPKADVTVYDSDGKILGFLGLTDGYIAGLFVAGNAQSGGIGKQLLDEAKKKFSPLSLTVFEQNPRAVAFYIREGFQITHRRIDAPTGAWEYTMTWNR